MVGALEQILVGFLVLQVLASSSARAQEQTFSLRGTVRTPEGNGAPPVSVRIIAPGRFPLVKMTLTQDHGVAKENWSYPATQSCPSSDFAECRTTVGGEYRFDDLKAGTYDLVACPICRERRLSEPGRYVVKDCEPSPYKAVVIGRIEVGGGSSVVKPVDVQLYRELQFHQEGEYTQDRGGTWRSSDTSYRTDPNGRVTEGGGSQYMHIIDKATGCEVAKILSDRARRYLFPGRIPEDYLAWPSAQAESNLKVTDVLPSGYSRH